MTIEHLVPDVETCIRLRDAGFPQDTIFVWRNYYNARGWQITTRLPQPEAGYTDIIAPLDAEILEVLPGSIITGKEPKTYRLQYCRGRWDYIWDVWSWRGQDCNLFTIPLPALYLRLKSEKVI